MGNSVKKLNPLLRLAAISGVEVAISHHIRRGDDLNAKDVSGATPLILAAVKKRTAAVRLLLDAGADPTLLDANGLDALAHASAVNCTEIINILTEALGKALGTTSVNNFEPELEHIVGSQPVAFTQNGSSEEISFENDWEADDETISPEGDDTVVETIKKLHSSIGRHKPITNDEDWTDVDLYLPDKATSIAIDEIEESVRLLILTILREGFISENTLADVCCKIDGTRDEEAERLLTFVVTQIGGSVVEWTQQEEPLWGEDNLENESLVDEATEFVKQLASHWNNPFRFYAKELRGELLDAKEEKALAQEMEEAASVALAGLAQWQNGLSELFNAADMVMKGQAKESEFSVAIEQLHDESLNDCIEIPDNDDEEINTEDQEHISGFLSAVSELRASEGNIQDRIDALKQIQLTRPFINKLVHFASEDPNGTVFLNAIKRHSAARERMTRCNLRLALSIAKKFMWSDLPLDDLVQEANIGLMKAVEKYDWRKGFRFSTYATWWIRQQVSRAIADTARVVRAPVHIQEVAKKIIKERKKIELQRGKPETDFETAQRIGMPLSKTKLVLSLFDGIESLDDLDQQTGCTRINLLEDIDNDPVAFTEKMALRSVLFSMLNELSEKSRDVLIFRFGLSGQDSETLEEIGQRFGLTRERIRQIESKALSKLSLPNKMEVLYPFLK